MILRSAALEDVFTFECDALTEGARVMNFRCVEGLSRLYEVVAHLTIESNDELPLPELLGARATLRVNRGELDPPLALHGILRSVELVHAYASVNIVRAVLVPQLWRLTLTRHDRVFVGETLPAILENVLAAGGLLRAAGDYELHLSDTYLPLEHVCQYQESHFAFISRWMEREGIYYYFRQGESAETLVITDDSRTQKPLRATKVRYFPLSSKDVSSSDCFSSFSSCHAALPGKVTVQDYNERNPGLDIAASALVSAGVGEIRAYAPNASSPEVAERLAALRAEELRASQIVYRARGNAFALRAGYSFQLSEHPRAAFNTSYLVTQLTHYGRQVYERDELAGLIELGDDEDELYRVDVLAVRSSEKWRPPRVTPTPRIDGVISAVIDGEARSDYAQIDASGAYKVRIRFDESGLSDGGASTWVRMLQPHGGNPEGFHLPLRKGTEVLLVFLGGDPDRPLIVGVGPNAHHPSPVTSANATQNVIQTGGRNRIEMEDLDASQYIDVSTPTQDSYLHLGAHAGRGSHNFVVNTGGDGLIHTGRDHDIVVGDNQSTQVVGHQTTQVGADREIEVSGHQTVDIAGDHDVDVGGDQVLRVAGAEDVKVGASQSVSVGARRTLAVGADESVTVAGSHSTTVGGSVTFDVAGGHTVVVGGSHRLDVADSYRAAIAGSSNTEVKGDEEHTVCGDRKNTTKGHGYNTHYGEERSFHHGATWTAYVGAVAEMFGGIKLVVNAGMLIEASSSGNVALKLYNFCKTKQQFDDIELRLSKVEVHIGAAKVEVKSNELTVIE